MKPIQVMFDEDLIRCLSECEEVREQGRSAVIRRAVRQYLRRRESAQIEQQYRKAYEDTAVLDHELKDWGDEGQWPPE